MGKFKKKASELKTWYRQNEAAILVAGTAWVGAVGWAVAGYYQGRAIKAEGRIAGMREQSQRRSEHAWPTIEVSPGCMEDIKNGAVLMYREARSSNRNRLSQHTTSGEFAAEADEQFKQFERENNA